MKKTAVTLLAVLTMSWAMEGLTDPPDHAPAHGWRKKHDPYVGYTGTEWDRDYDVREGHCDRNAVGAVLGGIAGAAIGSQVGDGDGRTVAIIVGATLGALIGARIERALDDGDRACMGHALEIGDAGHGVEWKNSATGVQYTLVPGKGSKAGNSTCRNFTLMAERDGKKASQQALACQTKPGVWHLVES